MKFRKKMVTLLAAVLIAMMGVMPALAASGTSSLEANVLPDLLYITAPATVDFGNLQRGASASADLIITTTGESGYTVDLTSSFVDATPAFFDPLTLNTQPESTYSEIAVALGAKTITLAFTVPSVTALGSHSGTLTIYASYT